MRRVEDTIGGPASLDRRGIVGYTGFTGVCPPQAGRVYGDSRWRRSRAWPRRPSMPRPGPAGTPMQGPLAIGRAAGETCRRPSSPRVCWRAGDGVRQGEQEVVAAGGGDAELPVGVLAATARPLQSRERGRAVKSAQRADPVGCRSRPRRKSAGDHAIRLWSQPPRPRWRRAGTVGLARSSRIRSSGSHCTGCSGEVDLEAAMPAFERRENLAPVHASLASIADLARGADRRSSWPELRLLGHDIEPDLEVEDRCYPRAMASRHSSRLTAPRAPPARGNGNSRPSRAEGRRAGDRAAGRRPAAGPRRPCRRRPTRICRSGPDSPRALFIDVAGDGLAIAMGCGRAGTGASAAARRR